MEQRGLPPLALPKHHTQEPMCDRGRLWNDPDVFTKLVIPTKGIAHSSETLLQEHVQYVSPGQLSLEHALSEYIPAFKQDLKC